MRREILAAVALVVAPFCASAPAAAPKILEPKPAAATRPEAALSSRATGYYFYCLAQQAMIRRDYGEALRRLEEAVASDPDSPMLATELARAYLNLEEPDRAIDTADRAILLDPNAIEPRELAVEAWRQKLSREEPVTEALFLRALRAHADLLALDPSNAGARMGLAKLHMARGDYAQAAEMLKIHLAAEPDSLEAAYLLSQALGRSGARSESRQVLEEAVARHSDFPELRRALAEAREVDGDLEGASAILQELVLAHPDRPAYRHQLARLLERRGRHEDAAREASALLRLLKGAPAGTGREAELKAAHLLLVQALAAGGRSGEALEAVLKAEREFPGETRFTLARAEILLQEGRDDDAAAVFDSLRSKARPGEAAAAISDVYLRAGSAREREGQIPRAEALLRRSIEVDPDNHRALNYLGYLLARRGENLGEALALIEKAVRLDADNGAYLDSLGWALFQLGRLEEAEPQLRRAAAILPEEAEVHDHLGDLFDAQGKTPAAIASWQEAIRLGHPEAGSIQRKIEKAGGTSRPSGAPPRTP